MKINFVRKSRLHVFETVKPFKNSGEKDALCD